MKHFKLLLISLLASFGLLAQTPQSKTLYELKPNERILFAHEHRVALAGNNLRWVLFLERIQGADTLHLAVVDGRESPLYNRIFLPEQTEFAAKGQFYFVGSRAEGLYVYGPDGELGPFDEVNPEGNSSYHLKFGANGELVFAARKGESWHIYHGKRSYVSDYPTDYRFDKFDLLPLPNGQLVYRTAMLQGTQVWRDDRQLGDYPRLLDFGISDQGQFAALWKENDEFILSANGSVQGPWQNIGYYAIQKQFYCVTYQENNLWYAHTHLGKLGPFDEISAYYGVKMDTKGTFWFGARTGSEWQLVFNGKNHPAGDHYGAEAYYNDHNFGYTYRKANQQYVCLNNQHYGPYQQAEWTDNYDLYKPLLGAAGEFAFVFKQTDKNGINHLGKESALVERITKPQLHPGRSLSYRYQQAGKHFLYALGQQFGPYDEFAFAHSPLRLHHDKLIAEPVRQDQQWTLLLTDRKVPLTGEASVALPGTDGSVLYAIKHPDRWEHTLYLDQSLVGTYTDLNPLYYGSRSNYALYADTLLLANRQRYPASEAIYSPDFQHQLLLTNTQVLYNGKAVSAQGGYAGGYDATLRSFYWMSLAGNSLMAYRLQVP